MTKTLIDKPSYLNCIASVLFQYNMVEEEGDKDCHENSNFFYVERTEIIII